MTGTMRMSTAIFQRLVPKSVVPSPSLSSAPRRGLQFPVFPAEPEALNAPKAGTIQLAIGISASPRQRSSMAWTSGRRSSTTRNALWCQSRAGSPTCQDCRIG